MSVTQRTLFSAFCAFFCLGASASPMAELNVYVFDANGLPASGALLLVDDMKAGESDDKGTLAVDVPAGTRDVCIVWSEQKTCAPAVTLGHEGRAHIYLDHSLEPLRVEVEISQVGTPISDQTLADEQERTEQQQELPGEDGWITGVVRSLDSQKPVSDVRIMVMGGDETKTNAAGQFQLKIVPGRHHISFVHESYTAEIQESIEVVSGEKTRIEISLSPKSVELAEVVIYVPHVAGSVASALDERKKSSQIKEVIGAKDLSRSGDGDAAGALRRVTGVTIVDGKYVYVRGLGERYSSTLLNGGSIPSPEPERRVVPLDLFPTSVLSGLVIHKTYNPSLPGNFGGGTIDLRTTEISDEFFLKLSVGTGGRAGSTFHKGISGTRGRLDMLGVDDGGRALPEGVREASANEKLAERDRFSERGYTADELESMGESMPNNWKLFDETIPPDLSLGADFGGGFEFGILKIGASGGFTYAHKPRRTETFTRNYVLQGQDGNLEIGHSYTFDATDRGVEMGAIVNVGASITEHHKFNLTSYFGRLTDNETRFYQGFNRDVDSNIRVTRFRWVERSLLVNQLSGTHTFDFLWGLGTSWRYGYSVAARHEPDRREVRYDYEPNDDSWLLSDRPEGNQRLYSDLMDQNHDGAWSLFLPFQQWNGLEGKVEAGTGFTMRSRASDTRRYKFLHKGEMSGDGDILSRNPEEIFVDENIGSDGFQLGEITRNTDNYSASQTILAGYGMVELPLWHQVHLSLGLRLEWSNQIVETFELFNADQDPVQSNLATIDPLPAATLTWSIFDNLKLRNGVSVTVSRPDFRELSPATFNDVTGGRQVFGNPDLERTVVGAYDLRLEWFPTDSTLLSGAFFYKYFHRPIEEVVILSAQQSVTYENADYAHLAGGEVEARLDYGFIHPYMSSWFTGANAALIYSTVSLGDSAGIQTSNQRPLQGQSPFVFNIQGGFDGEESGTMVVFLYNVFGPRITSVGAQGAPNIYEQPFHQLDMIVSQDLFYGLSFSFKAQNILDLPVRYTQGDVTLEERRKAREVSLSLRWAY